MFTGVSDTLPGDEEEDEIKVAEDSEDVYRNIKSQDQITTMEQALGNLDNYGKA